MNAVNAFYIFYIFGGLIAVAFGLILVLSKK